MGYVKHDRTKTLSQALIGDRDTIYYTSDNRAIVINGVEYGRKLVVTTQENFTELLKNAQLDSGTTYCIKGFTTKVHESSGLISAGHKIDLYVEALGPTNIKSRAYASYNTDGTDSFYEDRCIKVLEWDIKVSVIGSALGIALGMSVAPKEVAQLHSGSCKAVAHNKVDTLIVAYTNSDKVSISKDGGETFYTRTLPHKYTDTQDIIYGNNTFVIFEADGNLCVSKDNGETWRLITNVQYADVVAKSRINSQYYSGYTSACFGDNEFFIIGNGVGIRSVDGISWSTFVWGGYDNGWYKPCVAVGDGIIGITAYYGKIYWSFNNGSSFTLSNPESTYWEGIGFGNHTFSIVSGNRHGAIVLNTDLITSISWGGDNYYIGYIAVAKDPGKVSYNNGTFYCFGAYNPDSNYSYSEDGANWVSIPFPKSTYQGGYGQTRVDFGPAGEMYFADTLSNSIWMNPTPKDASTWQILSPTGIDIYDHSAISENACIIVPQESSSYYLSTDGVAYASYKFPGKMSSGGVIYVNKLFQTILYNLTTKRAFYAKSSDGISWILTDFPHEVNSVCSTIVTSEDGANILCIFEDGAKFWIRGDLVTPVSSTNYTSVHATYINNSFIYSGSNSGGNASKITKITQLENNTLSAEDIALPQSMVVSHVTSDSSTVYISGYDNSNKSTVYTYSFDSLSNTWSNLNLSGYITSSTKNGSKVIACTNLYNLYVLNYGEITEVPGIQVSNVYPTDNSTILCQLAGSDEMRTLGYTIVNDLQITELTDEFGNTCRFDFKNLKRTLGGTEVYFLGNGLEDYSLTGAVVNFKLKYGNDDTLLSTQFDIHNQLNCCELVGATSGIFTFPSGGNNISIGNTNTGCNFYNIGNVINNTSLKWVSSDANVLAVADLSLDARYLTTDSGITWSVDQTDSIPLSAITNLVLPQNPEGE